MYTTNTICRVGYCPLCEKSHQPKGGQYYLSFGAKANGFLVKTCERNGKIGFTPHIYKAKQSNGKMEVEIACAMYGCGVSRRLEGKSEYSYWFYFVKPESYIKEVWSITRWNALVLYKHDNDYEV